MMLGMSLVTFTIFHVIISLIAIASGLVVAFAMLRNRLPSGWNALFLVTTVLTSVTGFMFPFHGVTPAIKLGIVSLVVLAVAVVACYGLHLARGWRRIYAISAIVALYLNVFVLVVQSFQKVPMLKALAPTQSEPPFLAAQLIVLLLFGVLGVLAVKRFHNEPVRHAVLTH
ncbi:MAG: hypothetical protein JWM53_4032 [bacterium]|nr:hypothetical protein [bacterium]